MGINVNGDVSRGISTFKVNIFNKDGSKKSFPFPITTKEPLQFHTDNEAVAAFKEFHGVQSYDDVFEKNLENQDVICKFTDKDGVLVHFVRLTFQKWLGEKPKY